MPLASGTTFAGFTIVSRLDSAGASEVYLVQRPGGEPLEVLKILPADVSADAEFRRRFVSDADIAALLSHPNIVPVRGHGDADGRLWVSFDYVEGTDAGTLLSERYPEGLPLENVTAIVDAAASALDYARDRGLRHPDVTPASIILTDAGDGNAQRILLTGFGIGADTDEHSEQPALAATAYQLLTGRTPGRHANPALADARPDLAVLDPVLTRALAKVPAARFPRCADFAAAWRKSAAVPARTRPAPIRPVRSTQPLAPPEPVASPRHDRQRRNKLLRRGVAIVALVACLGIGIAIVASVWTQLFGGGLAKQKPAQATVTNHPLVPTENIRPLQVRPVQDVRAPDQCPGEGPLPVPAPSDPITRCDFMHTAAYVLGPQVMQVQLTHVETLKAPTSDFHVVRLTMDQASATTFGAYTAQHVGLQLAFLRDDIVVFAPKITQAITSPGLEISGNLTAQQATDMANLLRKPA